ncbi:MFS transporter [Capnocytophaga ochracea]
MIKKLWTLAIGGLALGTTEFLIMGLLRVIGEDMGLNDALTGRFISAYAIGVVVGAPTLIALAASYNPKKILIFFMVLFTLFNGLSAFSPDYTTLLLARFFSGLPHGAFFGVGAIAAKQLAPKGKEAFAISIMFAGLTIANLLMVPLLTYIGAWAGWRIAMGCVSILGLLTMFSVLMFLPEVENKRDLGVKREVRLFFNPKSLLVLAITALGCGGLFAWFSYIQPLMIETAHIHPDMKSIVMIVAGFGMVVGNLFGGWITDRHSPIKATIYILLLLISVLLLVFFFSHIQPMAWVLTFICGAMAMSLGSPLNMLIFRCDPQSEMMGAAFMQAAFNTANSIGAYIGGLPLLYGFSTNYPSLMGALLASIGLLITFYLWRLIRF